jgi:hypothetical protein
VTPAAWRMYYEPQGSAMGAAVMRGAAATLLLLLLLPALVILLFLLGIGLGVGAPQGPRRSCAAQAPAQQLPRRAAEGLAGWGLQQQGQVRPGAACLSVTSRPWRARCVGGGGRGGAEFSCVLGLRCALAADILGRQNLPEACAVHTADCQMSHFASSTVLGNICMPNVL